MAQRRMFSKKIIDTDLFIDMSFTARLLYYDFGMRADDEGFIDPPKKIMKMTGASNDDFKVLLSKGFILPFESGICVIAHWKIHNYVPKDRFEETHYKKEKKLLTGKDGLYTKCIQDVDIPYTQGRLGQDRLDQGRSGKIKKENNNINIIIKEKYAQFYKNFENKKKYEEFVYMTNQQYDNLINKYGFNIATLSIEKLNLWKLEKIDKKEYKAVKGDDYRKIQSKMAKTIIVDLKQTNYPLYKKYIGLSEKQNNNEVQIQIKELLKAGHITTDNARDFTIDQIERCWDSYLKNKEEKQNDAKRLRGI